MQRRNDHFHIKVTAKGQITLPVELRSRLGIEPGDFVEMQAIGSQEASVIEVRKGSASIDATAGIARPKVPYEVPDWDEVEQIIRNEVGERLHRETSG